MVETGFDKQYSLAIDPVRSEFCSHVSEARFLTHHLAETQSQLRTALLLCSFFYLSFALTDVAVLGFGEDAFLLFLARLAVVVSAAAGSLLSHRYPHSVAVTHWSATAVETVGMATFMLVVVFRPDELPWHAMSIAIMLIITYIYIPNRLAYSLLVALAATAAFIALAIKGAKLGATDLLTMSMLLLLANAFGVFAAHRYHRLWREQFRAHVILKNLSVRDHLTGCFNRRYLHEKLLDSEISRAQRFSLCLTVIICDIDHFKAVNDTFGHSGGDAVLRRLSHLLQTMTRAHIDSVVRYGGEEFLLVLPETNLHGGILMAERLRVAFAADATLHVAPRTIRATASFGVATVDFALNKKTITLDGLIALADELLYEAKSGGRNQLKSRLLA